MDALAVVCTQTQDIYDKLVLGSDLALALVGILGIGVATWTLFKIERQTKATEDAVAAAYAARALAEDTAKRQLRAYLGVAGKLYIRDDGSVEPRVTFTNCGQTPGYELQGIECGRFETRPFGKAAPPDQSILQPSSHIVGGGQPYYFTGRSVDSGKSKELLLIDLQSANYAFILNGWYTYRDIFKDLHHVDYQLIIGGGTTLQETIDSTGEWLGLFTYSEGNASN